jgi:hypothetical protein
MDEGASPRSLWRLFELYHALTYFAPESAEAYRVAGLRGFWMGYFAGRLAPFGPATPELAVAVLYNFHPAMVHRALPDAWGFAGPEEVLAARLAGMDAALRRLLGDMVEGPEVAEAAEIAEKAAAAADLAGRPLAAANATVQRPGPAHLRLWQAATFLREHRGDGHIAALMAAGLNGPEAHLTLVGTGRVSLASIKLARGWSDDAWASAESQLLERGILGEDGRLTEQGGALRAEVELATDAMAAQPWKTADAARFTTLMRPVADRIAAGGDIPSPNPMGLPVSST